jgi:hypothetical protein
MHLAISAAVTPHFNSEASRFVSFVGGHASPSGGRARKISRSWVEKLVEATDVLDCPSFASPAASRQNGLGLALSRGALVPVLGLGERSGKRDDNLPMLADRNIHVVAGEIQEHLLLG